jgi:hypothetical protein
MSQASSSSTYRLAVSLLIVVLIGLHAVPVLRPSQSRTLWPFMMWAMYKNSSPPGPIDAHTRTMTGTTARGDTLEVTSELVGLGIPAMNRMFGKPMLNGDSAAARRFLRRLNRNREDPVVELRLGGREYLVTDTGVAMEELPVITYRIDPSEARGER